MKKIAALVCSVILILTNIYAQYQPVVDGDKIWSVLHFRFRNSVTDKLTEHYRIDTTQEIMSDGQTWHPVYICTDTVFDWDSPDTRMIGIIREENKQVHYQGSYDEFGPDPIYDFNLLPGDTIEVGVNDVGEPWVFVVSELDTVLLEDGLPRKRFHTGYWFKSYDWEQEEFFPSDIIWVEGIGDITHGLLPQPGFMRPNRRSLDQLLCVEEPGGLIFQNPNYSSCFVEQIVSGAREPVALPLTVSPNPVRHYLTINGLDRFDARSGFLVITDVLGDIKLRINLQHLDSRHKLNLVGWPPGIYLLNIRGNKKYLPVKIVKVAY